MPATHTLRRAGLDVPVAVIDDDEPTVLAAWTATVVTALHEVGIDGDALAREAGIEPRLLSIEGARIDLSRTTELWRLAVERTGDPCFGISVARHVRPGTFGGLSVGIVASTTFREAFDRCVQFAAVVLRPAAETSVHHHADRYEYVTTFEPGAPVPAPESMEAITACLVRAGRFLLGRGVSPLEVRLQREVRPPSGRFEAFFHCPVVYGSDDYCLVYDAATLEQQLPSGSREVARHADRLASGYLERLHDDGPVGDEVRRVVRRLLPEAEPTAAEVAQRLAMSSRTLQRRLHDEGITFRALVAEVRIALAKELLVEQRLPVHVIAERLRFSDPAAFRRAFKRATGTTPAAFAASHSLAR